MRSVATFLLDVFCWSQNGSSQSCALVCCCMKMIKYHFFKLWVHFLKIKIIPRFWVEPLTMKYMDVYMGSLTVILLVCQVMSFSLAYDKRRSFRHQKIVNTKRYGKFSHTQTSLFSKYRLNKTLLSYCPILHASDDETKRYSFKKFKLTLCKNLTIRLFTLEFTKS